MNNFRSNDQVKFKVSPLLEKVENRIQFFIRFQFFNYYNLIFLHNYKLNELDYKLKKFIFDQFFNEANRCLKEDKTLENTDEFCTCEKFKKEDLKDLDSIHVLSENYKLFALTTPAITNELINENDRYIVYLVYLKIENKNSILLVKE